MNFMDAVKTCFSKYADFNGRAKRPEYWWFALFGIVVSILLEFISSPASWAFSLATMLPSLAVGSRRLHDVNKSGWLQLLWLIPILGWIYLIYLNAQLGDVGDNQYGPPPAN